MLDDNYRDISAFGGLPAYILALIIFFVLGNMLVSVQLAAGLILAYAATSFLRIVYFKERPRKQGYKNWWQKIDASSFPSLHSMRSAVLGIVLAGFFNNIILYFVFGLAVAGVVVTRVLLKRHDKIDSAAGLLIGIVIGLIVIFYGNLFMIF